MIHEIYKGKYCSICGTRWRYEFTHECVECHRYRKCVQNGNIVGIDGRKEKKQKYEDSENSD